MRTSTEQSSILTIEPSRGWVSLDLGALWQYRELIYFLWWRDIKVRYKQTLLGAAWAVLQPLLTVAVFSVFFGRLGRMPSDGLPYPLFALAALVPWSFFAAGLTQAVNGLVSSAQLVQKVYFPRLVIPVAAALGGVMDLLLALVVLGGTMAFYGVLPTVRMVWLPGLLVVAWAASLGTGLWLSALNVQYRDVRHALPFVMQLWMFATPIAYPSSLLAPQWRILYALNPMVGVVEGFRWAIGAPIAPGQLLAVSCSVTTLVLLSGVYYFRRVERTFADVI